MVHGPIWTLLENPEPRFSFANTTGRAGSLVDLRGRCVGGDNHLASCSDLTIQPSAWYSLLDISHCLDLLDVVRERAFLSHVTAVICGSIFSLLYSACAVCRPSEAWVHPRPFSHTNRHSRELHQMLILHHPSSWYANGMVRQASGLIPFAGELLFALVRIKTFASAPGHNAFIRGKGVDN